MIYFCYIISVFFDSTRKNKLIQVRLFKQTRHLLSSRQLTSFIVRWPKYSKNMDEIITIIGIQYNVLSFKKRHGRTWFTFFVFLSGFLYHVPKKGKLTGIKMNWMFWHLAFGECFGEPQTYCALQHLTRDPRHA